MKTSIKLIENDRLLLSMICRHYKANIISSYQEDFESAWKKIVTPHTIKNFNLGELHILYFVLNQYKNSAEKYLDIENPIFFSEKLSWLGLEFAFLRVKNILSAIVKVIDFLEDNA